MGKGRLYLISPSEFDAEAAGRRLAAALASPCGGVLGAFQLRLKAHDGTVPEASCMRAYAALAPVLRRHGVPLIVNDSLDLALRLQADGVHLGQGDGSIAAARARLGEGRILGVTCHDSLSLARRAIAQGADYVAFGAFFPSATKSANHRADLDLLRRWRKESQAPTAAIGGLAPAQAPAVLAAGADYAAASGGVWDDADDLACAFASWKAAIDAARSR